MLVMSFDQGSYNSYQTFKCQTCEELQTCGHAFEWVALVDDTFFTHSNRSYLLISHLFFIRLILFQAKEIESDPLLLSAENGAVIVADGVVPKAPVWSSNKDLQA
eukprot:TRINITY_DN5020_c0_g1_i8.p1 TRINITY_DN5020_c0_g1~~TRINITY_DN5020_c0_g1_i8.p1  ORF type:complete len:105 (-),score=15.36 TRINITY_DN5020_c0_g1_i8:547-861(-)